MTCSGLRVSVSDGSDQAGSGSIRNPPVRSRPVPIVEKVELASDAVKKRIARAKAVFAKKKLAQKNDIGPKGKHMSFEDFVGIAYCLHTCFISNCYFGYV